MCDPGDRSYSMLWMLGRAHNLVQSKLSAPIFWLFLLEAWLGLLPVASPEVTCWP